MRTVDVLLTLQSAHGGTVLLSEGTKSLPGIAPDAPPIARRL